MIQTGGTAAVAVTFGHYLVEMTGFLWPPAAIAGVKAGSSAQNLLMVLKILAILVLVVSGFLIAPPPASGFSHPLSAKAVGGALTPVLFAYGGWQTASFLSGEMKNPARDLARGLILGVAGLVSLYLLQRGRPPGGCRHRHLYSRLPEPEHADGSPNYYAMAKDCVFFEAIGTLYQRTQVPAAAILLQALLAAAIAFSGRYDEILNYVVSIDFIFFGLTGAVLYRRTKPKHPLNTVFFVLACWVTMLATIWKSPATSLVGLGILAAGVPVYFLWTAKNK